MTEIKIVGKKYSGSTWVDDDRAEEVIAAGPWRLNVWQGKVRGVHRHVRKQDGTRATQYLHTFLTGWPLVDHKNGDPLLNIIENLRPATNQENGRNRGKTRKNKSGYKGVSWHKASGKYQAHIKIDGRDKHLGCFDDPKEASAVYESKAKELFGEFYKEKI